jgi:hypothetical protein
LETLLEFGPAQELISMAIRTALHPRDIPETKTATAPSWFARAFNLILAARTRQAEREIALYLQGSGGKFTDEAEREIERRFLSNQTHW